MEGTGRGGSSGPLHGPAGSRPARVRNGAVYQRNARITVYSGRPCARCQQPIDLELTKRAGKRYLPNGQPNPEYMHRMAGTAGHIVSVHELRLRGELHRVNELSNLQPEHRACNSSEGGRIGAMLTNARRRGQTSTGMREPSQEWLSL